MSEIDDLTAVVRAFADAREWAQFHRPRNLVLALAGEVGELAAEFQWISDKDVDEALGQKEKNSAIQSEIADVAIYVLRLADVLGVNLAEAITEKLRLNEQRYPAEQARGNALKYTELGGS